MMIRQHPERVSYRVASRTAQHMMPWSHSGHRAGNSCNTRGSCCPRKEHHIQRSTINAAADSLAIICFLVLGF